MYGPTKHVPRPDGFRASGFGAAVFPEADDCEQYRLFECPEVVSHDNWPARTARPFDDFANTSVEQSGEPRAVFIRTGYRH